MNACASDRRILEHLKEHLGKDTPLTEITAGRISEYKDKRLATVRTIGKGEAAIERRLSVASVNRPLALLRCLLRLARDEWEVITKAPRMKLDREPHRMRWLKPEEAVRLLNACRQSKNTDLANLVEFCMFTGTRRGEALGLTWARVDRARGVVVLDADQTKTDEPREVRLNDHSDAVLALICSPIELDTDGAILLRQDGRASWAGFHGSRTADASSRWSSSAVSSSSC
jgi:integrase